MRKQRRQQREAQCRHRQKRAALPVLVNKRSSHLVYYIIHAVVERVESIKFMRHCRSIAYHPLLSPSHIRSIDAHTDILLTAYTCLAYIGITDCLCCRSIRFCDVTLFFSQPLLPLAHSDSARCSCQPLRMEHPWASLLPLHGCSFMHIISELSVRMMVVAIQAETVTTLLHHLPCQTDRMLLYSHSNSR